jgi:putative membrane protein
MMWGYGIGSWLVMSITVILLWGLIIAGIVALIHYIGGARNAAQQSAGPARPEDVLAARLAHGEIDTEEYTRRVEMLRGRR